MLLTIAGWRIRLDVSPPGLAEAVARQYAPFACPAPCDADLVVEVRLEDDAFSPVPSVSILQAPVTPHGEEYLLDGPQFYGMIRPSRGQAFFRMRSDEPTRETEYFLRIALAFFALQRDGLLVHCAALKRRHLVQLFVGQSGSGKSTIVALSVSAGRALALGDDLILVRRDQAGWRAYGTPFWNLEATAREGQVEHGPVAGIYKLVQDPSVYVEPMRPAVAAAELVANCPIVNDQPALLPVLIDRCREMASAIPMRRLHFRKDDAFWDIIPQEAP
jgi:hypothetical protein